MAIECRVLLVDDERGSRFGVKNFLEAQGYQVDEADCCRAAEEVFRASQPDAAIVDYMLDDGNALDLLPRLKAIDPLVPIVILTGHGSIDLAVRAMKEGAEHFFTKPVELPALQIILERLIDNRRHRLNRMASDRGVEKARLDPFLGTSKTISRLAEDARRVLLTDSPVLIYGETGSGKGVLARWLHENGSRCEKAFVDLNCAGLQRDFLETELFGHEKGAFTGAVETKMGLLEVGHRGTVFLDEIGDIHPEVQPKILKAIEEKRFRRLGGVSDRNIDIRLIAATHQDLGQLVASGKFRRDLFFRVSTIPLTVPPLRERVEDIPALSVRLLKQISLDLGRDPMRLEHSALEAIQDYPLPGNIRELRNILERATLLSDDGTIAREHLRLEVPFSDCECEFDSHLTLREVEQRYIEKVVDEENGHIEKAAQRLGVPRSSLYQKVKKYRNGSRV
jgi:DNA-binding NtrC family response regulator